MAEQSETGMRCVVCSKEAPYILMGSSYCKKHKDAQQKRINEILEKQNAIK